VEGVGAIGVPEDGPPQRHPSAGTNDSPELREADLLIDPVERHRSYGHIEDTVAKRGVLE
jgi:hypothetical protein